MCGSPESDRRTLKRDVEVHTCNPSTLEVEAGESKFKVAGWGDEVRRVEAVRSLKLIGQPAELT